MPPDEVRDGAREAARGREDPGEQDRLLDRHVRERRHVVEPGLRRPRLQCRVGQPDRVEQAGAEALGPRPAVELRDDLAEHEVAEVAVVPGGVRRGHAAPSRSSPRRTARSAASRACPRTPASTGSRCIPLEWVEQLPHRHARLGAARQEVVDLVVEAEPALVPQLQDHHRGERLRVARDEELGVDAERHGGVGEVRGADARRPEQVAAMRDPGGERRRAAGALRLHREPVEGPPGGVHQLVSHRPMLGAGAASVRGVASRRTPRVEQPLVRAASPIENR